MLGLLDHTDGNSYTECKCVGARLLAGVAGRRERESENVKPFIRWQFWLLLGVMGLGCALRLYGLDWDAGHSFHPDERQIIFHVTALSWPTSFAQFLDPVTSPLNPQFFAYGSFPIYLLAAMGHLSGYDFHDPASFVRLTLLGRVISALFDSGTILLTGCLAGVLARRTKQLEEQRWHVALLASVFLAFTPLHLQLSHFYAVDTLLAFFVLLTVLACVVFVETEKPFRWAALAGLAYGLALATKFSAAPLTVSLLVAAWLRWYQRRDLLVCAVALLWSAVLTIMIFFVTQPYALLDMPHFIQQVSEQGSLVHGTLDLPYVRQFAGTLPFLYQWENLVLWGMGLTTGMCALVGLCWLCWMLWRQRQIQSPWLIVLAWVIVYGLIVSSFYVKFMRYMLPLYPFLVVVAAAFVIMLVRTFHQGRRAERTALLRFAPLFQLGLLLLVVGGTIFQGLALLNVYSTPNTRIQASQWIYQHVAKGSRLTYEQWDDALPVALTGHDPADYPQATYLDSNGQSVTGLDLYGADTQAKAQQLAALLVTVNVITMPTDRLDKSIPRLPERYPLTIRYYQLLYSGQLGFHQAATFENHPHLFGIILDDSNADESYSVFDHPTAHLFVRNRDYPYTVQQLADKLLAGIHVPPA